MPQFQKYTFESETSFKTLTDAPTDRIDIPSLLKNRPYWIAHYGRKQIKNKVLLFNSSPFKFMESENNEKEKLLMSRLDALRNAGFKIYFDQFGQWTPLISMPKYITVNDNEEAVIELATKQLHLSRDELLVLNDAAIAHLMEKTDWHMLDDFESIDLDALHLNDLDSFLEEKGKNIKSLRALNHDVNAKISHGLTSLEHLDIGRGIFEINGEKIPGRGKDLKTLKINISTISKDDLLKDCDLHQLKELCIKGGTFKELYIKGQDPTHQILDLSMLEQQMKKNKVLQHLSLDVQTILGELNCDLSQLETLDLSHRSGGDASYYSISGDSLGILLKKAPHLKKLSLYERRIIGNLPQGIRLNQLEELDVTYMFYTHST